MQKPRVPPGLIVLKLSVAMPGCVQGRFGPSAIDIVSLLIET
jgi:hypothetical protein